MPHASAEQTATRGSAQGEARRPPTTQEEAIAFQEPGVHPSERPGLANNCLGVGRPNSKAKPLAGVEPLTVEPTVISDTDHASAGMIIMEEAPTVAPDLAT